MLTEADLPAFDSDVDSMLFGAISLIPEPCGSAFEALKKIDAEGLVVPPVREGTVGIHARALGGASLPLSDRFLVGATAAVTGG